MKLTNEQIRTVTETLNFNVIADDHEAQPQLESILGEHTFFINDSGLFAFSEQVDAYDDRRLARLFIVATWADGDKDALSPLKPPTEVDVIFDLENRQIMGGG